MRMLPELVALLLSVSSPLYSSAPLDTLKIIASFDSPVPHPRAILYDSPDFWISNMQPTLYKVDSHMRLIDSLPLRFARVTGMTFKDEELWVLHDSSVGSHLCKIDRKTGSVLDSINLQSSTSMENPGDSANPSFWGLVYYNSRFFLSCNGGWGPCILAIDIRSGMKTSCCCPHPIGMKVIGNEWWCVRGGSDGQGTTLAILGSIQWDSAAISSVSEKYRYLFPFPATDLAYDESNLWLVDQTDSKIYKMEGFQTKVLPRPQSAKSERSIFHAQVINGMFRIALPPDMTSRELLIVDMRGRTVAKISSFCRNAILYDCSALSPGMYGIRNRKVTGPAKGAFFISP
jgi:hypothetical protein